MWFAIGVITGFIIGAFGVTILATVFYTEIVRRLMEDGEEDVFPIDERE